MCAWSFYAWHLSLHKQTALFCYSDCYCVLTCSLSACLFPPCVNWKHAACTNVSISSSFLCLCSGFFSYGLPNFPDKIVHGRLFLSLRHCKSSIFHLCYKNERYKVVSSEKRPRQMAYILPFWNMGQCKLHITSALLAICQRFSATCCWVLWMQCDWWKNFLDSQPVGLRSINAVDPQWNLCGQCQCNETCLCLTWLTRNNFNLYSFIIERPSLRCLDGKVHGED